MERIYTIRRIITTEYGRTLLDEDYLNEDEYNHAVEFLRKFTGLWEESVCNDLPCFTCTDEDDGILTIIFN